MPLLKIVGSKHYPPAKEILKTLPLNTNLKLIPEKDNSHDPNAIAVWIYGEEIFEKTNMHAVLYSQGDYMIGEAIKSRSWQLGYIEASIAKILQPFSPKPAKLVFSADGSPMVEIE